MKKIDDADWMELTYGALGKARKCRAAGRSAECLKYLRGCIRACMRAIAEGQETADGE